MHSLHSLLARFGGWLRSLPGLFSFRVWLLAFALAGALVGLGGFTFVYAKGYSYLSNDPAACANCHVMREFYDAWNRSPHHAFATCDDCHTPTDMVGHYAVEAINGYNHSSAFTLNNFHEPIRIKPLNRSVVEQNCLECHADLVTAIGHAGTSEPTDCLRCHSDVGHGNTP